MANLKKKDSSSQYLTLAEKLGIEVNVQAAAKLKIAVINMRRAGFRVNKIAKTYHIETETVRGILKEAGFRLGAPSRHLEVGMKDKKGMYATVYIGIGKPGANAGGWISEHRLVMQRYLGRVLEPWEVVHHINRDKTDNRLENLKLVSRCDHPTCNACPYYKFYIEHGGKDLTKN